MLPMLSLNLSLAEKLPYMHELSASLQPVMIYNDTV
jgi:hypothetical protein